MTVPHIMGNLMKQPANSALKMLTKDKYKNYKDKYKNYKDRYKNYKDKYKNYKDKYKNYH